MRLTSCRSFVEISTHIGRVVVSARRCGGDDGYWGEAAVLCGGVWPGGGPSGNLAWGTSDAVWWQRWRTLSSLVNRFTRLGWGRSQRRLPGGEDCTAAALEATPAKRIDLPVVRLLIAVGLRAFVLRLQAWRPCCTVDCAAHPDSRGAWLWVLDFGVWIES